ncbi:MAG: STAS domain-containing protein [Gammaproteobacteria bacterium]|nr:STAS domain-containing protein [Gammaproteobacteria bacterium]
MNNAAIQALGDGRFLLTGDLDFNDVPQLLSAGTSMFAHEGARLVLDLSGVRRTTSVGLALMVEWLRRARQANKSIEFQNVPAQMLAMAKISGLDGILIPQPQRAAT